MHRSALLMQFLVVITAICCIVGTSLEASTFQATCIHEQLTAEHGELLKFKAPQGEMEPMHTGRMLLQQNLVPYRIFVDTRYLDSDPERTCYSAGQAYKVGTPPSATGPACSSISGQPNNCWGVCGSSDVLTAEKKASLINTIMPQAIDFFSKSLSVQRTSASLKLGSAPFCGAQGGVPIPSGYITNGVANTDLILFATARPTPGSVVAWAVQCQEQPDFRPVAGQINFGPQYLGTDPTTEQYAISTAIHEMTHVVGFSNTKFGEFVDPNGNQRPLSQVVQQVTATGANGVTYPVSQIVTPSVVDFVRQHFNCSSMTGAQLEDGGGAGTAGTHWEKRIFGNEYMTGIRDSNGAVITALSVALLGDTGWYVANYAAVQPLVWGYARGCSFVQGSCSCPTASSSCTWTQYEYSCTTAVRQTCNFDRTAKSLCSVGDYRDPIPEQYRYMGSEFTGGANPIADYCPIPLPASNGVCTNTALNTGNLQSGETFGTGSRCFMTTLSQTAPASTLTSGCYPVTCTNTSVQIGIGGRMITCPPEGGDITVPGYSGVISCPDYNDLCGGVNVIVPPACPLGNCYPSSGVYTVGAPVLGAIIVGAVLGTIVLVGICCCIAFRVSSRRRRLAGTPTVVVGQPAVNPLAPVPYGFGPPPFAQAPPPSLQTYPGSGGVYAAPQPVGLPGAAIPYGQPRPTSPTGPGPYQNSPMNSPV